MKKITALFAAFLLSAGLMAQAPQKMSYQAIVRDGSNNLVVNTQVGIQISILQGSGSGTAVYVETHLPSTNVNGLVTLEIGTGSIITGTFGAINWATGPYFLKTETDPDGSTGGIVYSIVGSSELLSVPYALYSASSGASGGTNCCNNQWHLLGNANTVDNTNFLGTTDNVPFNIRVNNLASGRIDHLMNNTFLGFLAANANTTGYNNSIYGSKALNSNTSGYNNTALGYAALFSNTIGRNNSATGDSALYSNVGGLSNTANGALSLFANTTGGGNIAMGYRSLFNNTNGDNNSGLGASTLYKNTTGFENTAVGGHSLYSNSVGQQNTAVGAFAMQSNSSGSVNTAIGGGALNLNTQGSYNSAIGFQTLASNITGKHNIAGGYLSMWSNTAGYNNAAYGSYALNINSTGYDNTSIGYLSLKSTTASSGNTALGANAGDFGIDNGNNNTFIGYNTTATTPALNNAAAIGYNAQVAISNAMVLGGTNSDAINVGIGTTAPHSRMHVNGSLATTIVGKGSNYTLGIDDQIVLVKNATTITLPSAFGIAGRMYTIKRADAFNLTTIATTGAETIDGASTQTLNTLYAGITVVSDGNHWYIIARF